MPITKKALILHLSFLNNELNGKRLELRRDAKVAGTNIIRKNLSKADLCNVNFSNANLHYTNLRGANLSGADLRGAKLLNADLYDADLFCANLSYAFLRNANLSCADLCETNLSGADLFGANLSGANLKDANLAGADLRGAKLFYRPLVVENIYSKILKRIGPKASKLHQPVWHCGIAHCMGGWAITLTGNEGKQLEAHIGPNATAALIFAASDPLHPVPDFYVDDATALEMLKVRAATEK